LGDGLQKKGTNAKAVTLKRGGARQKKRTAQNHLEQQNHTQKSHNEKATVRAQQTRKKISTRRYLLSGFLSVQPVVYGAVYSLDAPHKKNVGNKFKDPNW